MTEHVDAPRKVVTITREEVHPRAQYAYAGNWRWVYSFEGLKKPLARLELAVEAAKKTYPGCKVELAWRAGGGA